MPPYNRIDAQRNGNAACSLFTNETWESVSRSLRLSGRETEIVQGVFDDQKEEAIASELGISRHTVHTHLERLYHKLSVRSRVELLVRVFAEYVSLTSGLHGDNENGHDGRNSG